MKFLDVEHGDRNESFKGPTSSRIKGQSALRQLLRLIDATRAFRAFFDLSKRRRLGHVGASKIGMAAIDYFQDSEIEFTDGGAESVSKDAIVIFFEDRMQRFVGLTQSAQCALDPLDNFYCGISADVVHVLTPCSRSSEMRPPLSIR
jgi:hypothetical protein